MKIRSHAKLGLGAAILAVSLLLSSASAAAIRVLPPGSSSQSPVPVLCLAEYLAQRLGECKGVDIVHGKRAERVSAWLYSATFEFAGEQAFWERLQSYISIDAMVAIVELPTGKKNGPQEVTVEIQIFKTGGTTRLKAAFPDPAGQDLPHLISSLGQRVGRELGLSDADVRVMAEVRIEDPAFLGVYYTTKNVWAPWPVNSYVGSLTHLAALPEKKFHWSRDAATVRVCAGYIHQATHGRQSDKLKQAIRLAKPALLRLLGSGHEEEAWPLLRLDRLAATETLLSDIEADLLQIAHPLGFGKVLPGAAGGENDGEWVKEIEDLSKTKPGEKAGVSDPLTKLSDLSAGLAPRLGPDFTTAQRVSALRMLGVMASAKAIPLLTRLALLEDSVLREAAALALADFRNNVGIDVLTRLSADADARVAFAAARSLVLRKHPPVDFRQRAIAFLERDEPYRTWAAEALASSATNADQASLERLANDTSPSVRAAVHRAKFANDSGDANRLAEAMLDPESDIVINAIRRIPRDLIVSGSDVYSRLVRLANDPDNAVAQTALDTLWPLRPADPHGRARFDLATAAPYFRHKAVATLKGSKESWARPELIAACENSEAHTRIAALEAMTALDMATARGLLLKAIRDPHLLVRLRAASLLAAISEAAQAGEIRQAISRQKDRATALYLQDALAHAEGKPLPAPLPAANSILGATNIAWLSPGGGNPDSPYQAYYAPSHGNHVRDDIVSDANKQAHANGKVFFSRISPIGNPGMIMVDALSQDQYWLYLDDQLGSTTLSYIDGVVYGEESMSMDPNELWPAAWRFFCDDVGIDPKHIAGDRKNLNPYEAHAWTVWGSRRCVEGFNRLYDYTKLKAGKLHPGIAVCTFLGQDDNAAAFDWKFDLGGIYHYVGHTRKDAFSLVRRYKTIWPDRPVLWLSNGIGVYERTPIQYTFQAPTAPIINRTYRAYTDSLTAWMAGADTGWFSIWAFLPMKPKDGGPLNVEGPTVSPEDITPESPRLRACIDFAFAGVEKMLREKAAAVKLKARGLDVQPLVKEGKNTSNDTLDEPAKTSDGFAESVARDKEKMYLGFQIYRKHLLDLARLFASLPRNNPKPDVLVVQPGLTVWDGVIGSPGSDLLAYYDFLLDINQAPRLNLNRYRMIAVKDPGALTDETIDSITRWLRETPGVLYVHLDLTADNSRQFATPEHFDGKLKLDWPWEGDLSIVSHPPASSGSARTPAAARGKSIDLTSATAVTFAVPDGVVVKSFEITGKSARALLTSGTAPVLAVWQRADFKGAVVFDGIEGGGKIYREALRRVLAELKTKSGVGIDINSPLRHEMLATDQLVADATAGSTDANTIRGIDMLTGALDPVVGPSKSAALVARNFQGKYAASFNGISVLCDQPIRKIEKIAGGLRIECDGLIQAASETGRLEFKPDSGPALPAIRDDKLNHWVLFENSEGSAIQATGDGQESRPGSLVYIRSRRPITCLAK
jgi:HEAT repeat protein